MIRIVRPALAPDLAQRLPPLTGRIAAARDRAATARSTWRHSTVRAPLREVLAGMAPGLERCMYCGDSQGTDIDHFEPVARNPLRTFDWLNHLLACSTCNSGLKRDRFPVDARGGPLLIDPTVEDPFDHLLLTPTLGVYAGLTEKGRETIDVCGLNRRLLTEGRRRARRAVLLCLEMWARAHESGSTADMREAVLTIREQPFADVCQSMLRLAANPAADRVLDVGPRVLAWLRMDELRHALLA